MNICNTLDTIQREMSVMLVEMADGSPPAEAEIHTDSDTLLSKLSEMTVKSERWMERFIMNIEVWMSTMEMTCFRIRHLQWYPEVTEKWMDRFVVDLVECPSVSRTSTVARTFGPAVSEEYSPVVFPGGRLPMHTPWWS